MQIRAYNLIVFALALFAAPISVQAQDDSAQNREYQVKAAFLYNFVKFVDWPKEKTPDSNEPIIIGIIGNDPFGNAFEPIKDKPVKGTSVIIKRFLGLKGLKESSEKHPQIEAIRECHLLFICRSEKQNLTETINLVKDHSVLTVADSEVFLESGGIINFVMEENKVRFEINVTAAKQAKLQIRSQLLRLAKRVAEEKPSGEAKS
jgi:hypothetical protein